MSSLDKPLSEIGARALNDRERAESVAGDPAAKGVQFRKSNTLKMVIVPFEDAQMQIRKGKPFYVPINPESFQRAWKPKYDTRGGQGNEGTDPRYKRSDPEMVKVDFTLDGTQSVEGYVYQTNRQNQYQSVSDQIKALKHTVYRMDNKTHKPPKLIIFWGPDFKFPCILSDLTINYTLFDSEGNPLRAKISASFKEFVEPKKRERRQRCESPDITHIRTFRGGDRLDLMSFNIYTKSQYVLQLAAANDLTSIRQVNRGKEIVFPPIDKTESV